MNLIAYAHSLPGQSPDKWQPLDEHLKAVAEMAMKAREFDVPFVTNIWIESAQGWDYAVRNC